MKPKKHKPTLPPIDIDMPDLPMFSQVMMADEEHRPPPMPSMPDLPDLAIVRLKGMHDVMIIHPDAWKSISGKEKLAINDLGIRVWLWEFIDVKNIMLFSKP